MRWLISIGLAVLSQTAQAKLNVVTTLTDLAVITEEVGKGEVGVMALGRGTQDPHFIEAKPSFMSKVNRADLVISIGLDLEIGWLPSIIRGARNPKVNKGQKGYLEVGPMVTPLEVATGQVTRAEGDVHPFGNPHVTLDPIRAGRIARLIAERLGELDPNHRAEFLLNAEALEARLTLKAKDWQARIDQSGVKQIVTYHRTLTYFFDRFHIVNPMILEPKPGIPPTSRHILEVIETIKKQKIPLILVENFFDPTVTEKIKASIPGIRTATVAVSVGGAKGVDSIENLYEQLVQSIEGKVPP